MHSMSGQRQAMHVHGAGEHVRYDDHSTVVLSCGWELWLPALVSV